MYVKFYGITPAHKIHGINSVMPLFYTILQQDGIEDATAASI